MDARRSLPGQPGFEPAACPLSIPVPGSVPQAVVFPQAARVGGRVPRAAVLSGHPQDCRISAEVPPAPASSELPLPEGCRWLCLLRFSSEPGGQAHTAKPRLASDPPGPLRGAVLVASPGRERGVPGAPSVQRAGERRAARLRLRSHVVERRAEGREAGGRGGGAPPRGRGRGGGVLRSSLLAWAQTHSQPGAAARAGPPPPLPLPPPEPLKPLEAPPPQPRAAPAAPACARAASAAATATRAGAGARERWAGLGWVGAGAGRRGGSAGEDARAGSALPGSGPGLHRDRRLPAPRCPRPRPGPGRMSRAPGGHGSADAVASSLDMPVRYGAGRLHHPHR